MVTGPPVCGRVRRRRRADAGGDRLCQEAAASSRRRSSDVETPKGDYLAVREASARQGRGRRAARRPGRRLLRGLSFPEGDALGRVRSTTARASCRSAARSAGSCSSTAAASCRSRSAAPTLAQAPLVQEVRSGAMTYGHRFLTTQRPRRPRREGAARSTTTEARLAEHFVVLDREERHDRIAPRARRRTRAASAAASHARRRARRPARGSAGSGRVPDGRRRASSRPSSCSLPEEVLTTTMIHHQHYFPVVDDARAS